MKYFVRGIVIFALGLSLSFSFHWLTQAQVHQPIQRENFSSALERSGKQYYDVGQFSAALQAWQQELKTYENEKDKLKQAYTLSLISLAYQQLGQWQSAEEAIASSFALLDKIPGNSSDRTRAQILNRQGRLQLAKGETEAALETAQQAEFFYDRAGDSMGVIGSKVNQVRALQALGFYRRSQKILTQLEQQLETIEDSPAKIASLHNLGNLYRQTGDLEKAKQILEMSLNAAQKLSIPIQENKIWLSLANLDRIAAKQVTNPNTTQQEYRRQALSSYQKAEQTAPFPSIRIQAQLNRLSLLIETNQSSPAQKLLLEITPILEQLPASRESIDARINLAQSLLKMRTKQWQSPSVSQENIVKTLEIALKQAQSLSDRSAQAQVLGYLGLAYEQTGQLSMARDFTQQALLKTQEIQLSEPTYQWQWQLGRILLAQKEVKAATSSYSEAVKNLQFLRRDLVTLNPDFQFSFREQVEPIYRQLVELLLQTDGESEPPQENLVKARQTIESLQLAELENFFRQACLQPKVELDRIVDRADSTTAVIYPIILQKRLAIIVKLPQKEQLLYYQMAIDKQQLEEKIKLLRQSLQDVTQTIEVNRQAAQFYDWLIRPLEANLQNDRIESLVFVLDGVLQNIPMGVLFDRQQQKYLVEKYALALAPGLQLVESRPIERVKLKALTAGLDRERLVSGLEFPALVNVKRELDNIREQVANSEQLFNENFTKDNLQNQIRETAFSVVHLATHVQFSSEPENTFILAWNQLLKVKDFDDLLRLRERGESGAIELLVLSACETAEGDKRAALGLAGTALQAGARSTLATLWAVDDLSTSQVMSQFYRELKTGATKAKALQKAQLEALKTENRPYFWASYILIGNWL
jgi:CHAT domain-containing protein